MMKTAAEVRAYNEGVLARDVESTGRGLSKSKDHTRSNWVMSVLTNGDTDCVELALTEPETVKAVFDGSFKMYDGYAEKQPWAIQNTLKRMYECGVLYDQPEVLSGALSFDDAGSTFPTVVSLLKQTGASDEYIMDKMPTDLTKLMKIQRTVHRIGVRILNNDYNDFRSLPVEHGPYDDPKRCFLDTSRIVYAKIAEALNASRDEYYSPSMISRLIKDPNLPPRGAIGIIENTKIFKSEDDRLKAAKELENTYTTCLQTHGKGMFLSDTVDRDALTNERARALDTLHRLRAGGWEDWQRCIHDKYGLYNRWIVLNSTSHKGLLADGIWDAADEMKDQIRMHARWWQEDGGLPISCKLKLMFKGTI
jgi:hypothetical protein